MGVLERRWALHRRDGRISPVTAGVSKQDRHHIADTKSVRGRRRDGYDLGDPLRLANGDSSKCGVAREIRRRAKTQPGYSGVREVVGIPQIANL